MPGRDRPNHDPSTGLVETVARVAAPARTVPGLKRMAGPISTSCIFSHPSVKHAGAAVNAARTRTWPAVVPALKECRVALGDDVGAKVRTRESPGDLVAAGAYPYLTLPSSRADCHRRRICQA